MHLKTGVNMLVRASAVHQIPSAGDALPPSRDGGPATSVVTAPYDTVTPDTARPGEGIGRLANYRAGPWVT